MIGSNARAAAFAAIALFGASAGQAQDAIAQADLDALRSAYALIEGGDFDEAIRTYRRLRVEAGTLAMQRAATEGEAFARVAEVRTKLSDNNLNLMQAGIAIKLDSQRAVDFIEAARQLYPDSQRLAYVLAVASETDQLSSESYEGLPDFEEYQRLDAIAMGLIPTNDQVTTPVAAQPATTTATTQIVVDEAPAPAATPEPAATVVDEPLEEETVATGPVPDNLYRATSNSRVRGGPGTGFAQVGSLSVGDIIEVEELVPVAGGPGWFRIAGDRGFIFARLVVQLTPEEAADYLALAAAPADTPEVTEEVASAADASACQGGSIGTFRALREVQVFDGTDGVQIDTLQPGNVLSSVTGTAGVYLVYLSQDDAGRPVCHYAPNLAGNFDQLN